MPTGDILSLVAIAGVVLAIWLGRRKGRARFSAAVASARAEGHADAKVELAATLANVVNVQVGHDARPGTRQVAADDLYQRVLRESSFRSAHELGPGHDEFHDLDHEYHDDLRALGIRRRPPESQQFVDVGPVGRSHRPADGDGVDGGSPEMTGWARPA